MAFKVGSFEGVTIVGITDPHLAAAVRALGQVWEDVRGRPEAGRLVAEAVRLTEELVQKVADAAAVGAEPAVAAPSKNAKSAGHRPPAARTSQARGNFP
jgi:hypothetical protein